MDKKKFFLPQCLSNLLHNCHLLRTAKPLCRILEYQEHKLAPNMSTVPLSRITVGIVLFVLSLGLFTAPDADAWWNDKWEGRKKIQFDTSSTGAGINDNLADLPVLVRLHTGNFDFAGTNSDGSDIRFVGADDKTMLKYHIEKFDLVEEIGLIWVRLPRVTGNSNQDFAWIYFGNTSAADGQDTEGGTYDLNQLAVYHMGEQYGDPVDATAYGNHVISFSGAAGLPSIVGNGVHLSGGPGMKIARSSSLSFANGFTFSTWIRPGQTLGNARIFSWDDGRSSVVVGIDNAGTYAGFGTKNGKNMRLRGTGLTPDTWHHMALTIGRDKLATLYVDGNRTDTNKLMGNFPEPDADITVGAAFNGDMDEVGLAGIARPSGWIKAAFYGQGSDARLISILDDEAGGNMGESLTVHLMKVIIRTITLDGWIIIGILGIIGFIAVFVFQQKITVIKKTSKENDMFFKLFRNVDHPLAFYENGKEYPESSLYSIYQAGCDELKIWAERKGTLSNDENIYSQNAKNIFKAAVEKEAIYESRSLAAGMAIMNICVAGGPFLGLFGTVWGVMNTFASMAESGDANLMLIAPGVASALACTLAGLLVAIPALFANNYLVGLIKDMNADIYIFIDDLIVKLEEDGGSGV